MQINDGVTVSISGSDIRWVRLCLSPAFIAHRSFGASASRLPAALRSLQQARRNGGNQDHGGRRDAARDGRPPGGQHPCKARRGIPAQCTVTALPNAKKSERLLVLHTLPEERVKACIGGGCGAEYSFSESAQKQSVDGGEPGSRPAARSVLERRMIAR